MILGISLFAAPAGHGDPGTAEPDYSQGPILPSDITVSPMGTEAVVRIKGRLLFT